MFQKRLFNMKFPWTKKRRTATARREITEYADRQYTIVELFVPQRMAIDQFAKANAESNLLIMAFVVSQACEQFLDEPADELALNVAPGCLSHIAKAIMEMNGIGAEQEEEIEKKSESSTS